ncbi:MAG TPA: NAD(P)-dependent oxidoreductase [Kofleriaceae bacterium]|nr:NAD(P)-dependent oxidoreductase [Kofleriaceae bacterium]
MKALVTGATGFIGRHLCAALRAAGDEVTALVRSTSRRDALEPLGVTFAVGDVNQPASLASAADGADVVFHLAAMLGAPWHPDFLRTNADGVRHVAEACASLPRPPRLVVTSSAAASGPSPAPGVARVEDDRPTPVSRYGESKLAGEQAARDLAGRLPITIVRPPVVFGGGDRAMLPLFQMAARGLAVTPTRDQVSLVHVEDLVALLRAAAAGETLATDGPPGRGVYFGGFDEAPTWPALARRVAAAVGRSRTLTLTPPRWMLAAGGAAAERWARWRGTDFELLSGDKAREGLAGDWIVSPAKAGAQLGWRPAASLDARLADTARAYRADGLL